MHLIEPHHARTLLEHVAGEAPDLLNACRWLLLDPRLAPLILDDDARQPTLPELTRFVHLLHQTPAGATASSATASSTTAGRARSLLAVALDLPLERLLAAGDSGWHHPTEILGHRCPDFTALLAACLARLKDANGDHPRLAGIRARLERAARIETSARRRRQGGGGA